MKSATENRPADNAAPAAADASRAEAGAIAAAPPPAGSAVVPAQRAHYLFRRFLTALYFDRLRVVGLERVPDEGPVIWLGLHRNGAVDGFVYQAVIPEAVFMISSQLQRSPFARLVITGIPVVREKDAARDGDPRERNPAALERCQDLLRAGGELFVFPEGTSKLGPRHLPFRWGAARIALEYVERGGRDLRVIPLGIHYERGWAFRSRVEVVIGEPVALEFGEGASPEDRIETLKAGMERGLHSVGLNFESAEDQRRAEGLASLAALDGRRSYFSALKTFERAVPGDIAAAWRALDEQGRRLDAPRFQELPLAGPAPLWRDALAVLLSVPLVGIGAALNFVPLAAGHWSGEKFSDDTNVVTFHRVLVGVPLWVLWVVGWIVFTLANGAWSWLALYAVATWTGLKLYRSFKLHTVSLCNRLRFPELSPLVRDLHALLNDLPPKQPKR